MLPARPRAVGHAPALFTSRLSPLRLLTSMSRVPLQQTKGLTRKCALKRTQDGQRSQPHGARAARHGVLGDRRSLSSPNGLPAISHFHSHTPTGGGAGDALACKQCLQASCKLVGQRTNLQMSPGRSCAAPTGLPCWITSFPQRVHQWFLSRATAEADAAADTCRMPPCQAGNAGR